LRPWKIHLRQDRFRGERAVSGGAAAETEAVLPAPDQFGFACLPIPSTQSNQTTQKIVHANTFQPGWMPHQAATKGMGNANTIGRAIQRSQKNRTLAGSPKAAFFKIPIITKRFLPPLSN
jgi:hypothetical protein